MRQSLMHKKVFFLEKNIGESFFLALHART